MHTGYAQQIHILIDNLVVINEFKVNKKDRWDSVKPRCQQTLLCVIQIKVIIFNCWQIFLYMQISTTQNLNDLDFDL